MDILDFRRENTIFNLRLGEAGQGRRVNKEVKRANAFWQLLPQQLAVRVAKIKKAIFCRVADIHIQKNSKWQKIHIKKAKIQIQKAKKQTDTS